MAATNFLKVPYQLEATQQLSVLNLLAADYVYATHGAAMGVFSIADDATATITALADEEGDYPVAIPLDKGQQWWGMIRGCSGANIYVMLPQSNGAAIPAGS